MRGRADILVRHAEAVYCLCMDKEAHIGYCPLIGVKGSSSEKRKKQMTTEILNLDDLQRILKALIQYQETTQNEEGYLTKATIKRVVSMGVELETIVKDIYQDTKVGA